MTPIYILLSCFVSTVAGPSQQPVQNDCGCRANRKMVVVRRSENRFQKPVGLTDRFLRNAPGRSKQQKVRLAVPKHAPEPFVAEAIVCFPGAGDHRLGSLRASVPDVCDCVCDAIDDLDQFPRRLVCPGCRSCRIPRSNGPRSFAQVPADRPAESPRRRSSPRMFWQTGQGRASPGSSRRRLWSRRSCSVPGKWDPVRWTNPPLKIRHPIAATSRQGSNLPSKFRKPPF